MHELPAHRFQGAVTEYLGPDFLVFGQKAIIQHYAKVEGNGFLTVCDAVACQCVEIGVARGVVGLAGEADDTVDRGEEDEEVKRGGVLGKEAVQVPGSGDLGRCGGFPGGVGHCFV